MSRGSRHTIVGFAFASALCVVALDVPGVATAEACGGFFRSKEISPEERPSLSREKVLLIHDEEKAQQHFIREVAFKRAKEPFGFVVPTPTRPSVHKIKKTPFTKLRDTFPFLKPPPAVRGAGASGGGGFAKGGGGVQVLEKKKVGSFTAFVLAATDENALGNWLEKNGLVSAEDTDEWLAHYVHMGFFYVAMRYDPPRKPKKEDPLAATNVKAETIRISFPTPIPYYPYLEPSGPKANPEARLLEMWYVGAHSVVPVALRESEGETRWVRPLRPGETYENWREQVGEAFEKEVLALLPEGELVLQTFQDQKFSRAGFQDILFAAAEPRELPKERAEQLEPLLAILDPALLQEAQ